MLNINALSKVYYFDFKHQTMQHFYKLELEKSKNNSTKKSLNFSKTKHLRSFPDFEKKENEEERMKEKGTTPMRTKVMMDFICQYESGECTCSDETSNVIWVPKDKVLEYITSPAQIYRFKKVLEFKERITYSSYVTKPDFQVLSERYI